MNIHHVSARELVLALLAAERASATRSAEILRRELQRRDAIARSSRGTASRTGGGRHER